VSTLRSRRSFTLLELMIAFVIMAILAAIAIPSLTTVAQGDRAQAEDASAISLADAAYYKAVAADATGSGTQLVDYATELPTGSGITITTGAPAGSPLSAPYVDGSSLTGPLYYNFPDGVVVQVSAGVGTDASSAPTATIVAGVGGTPVTTTTTVLGGGPVTTTTAASTTTTAPYVEPTCSVSVTGPYVYNTTPSTWSMTCTGVTAAEVQVSIPVGAGDFAVSIFSQDYFYGSGSTRTALPSSFTVNQSTVSQSSFDTTDAVPGAIDVGSAHFVPTGWTFSDLYTAQSFGPGNNDSCMNGPNVGCGTPTYTLTDFPVALAESVNSPYSVSTDGTHVWAGSTGGSHSVVEFDATTGAPIQTIAMPGQPVGISSDGTHVWVSTAFVSGNAVVELDASTGAVLQTIPVTSSPEGISSDGTHVWVALTGSNADPGANTGVAEIDASTGSVIQTISIPGTAQIQDVYSDGTDVWVADYGFGKITELDASTGAILQSFHDSSGEAYGITAGAGHVWVANYGGTVTQYDATTGTLQATITVGTAPTNVAFDGTHLWVSDSNYGNTSGGDVSEIDISTDSVINTITSISSPQDVSAHGTNIWATDTGNGYIDQLVP
jgi:prepilin-type N-terminal cleavage/methylation domain-containing protein